MRTILLRAAIVLGFVAILCRQAVIETYYIWQSEGDATSPGSVSLRGSSAERFVTQLDSEAGNTTSRCSSIVDTTEDYSAFRLAALDFQGCAVLPVTYDFIGHAIDLKAEIVKPRADLVRAFTSEFTARGRFFSNAEVRFDGAPAAMFSNDSRITDALHDSKTDVLYSIQPYDVLNKWWFDAKDQSSVVVRRAIDLHNHLSFLASSLGSLRNVGAIQTETLSFPERDPTFVADWIQGINRYMLLADQDPAPRSRILISFSRTMYDRGETPLPKEAAIVGTRRVRFGFTGSGSARLFSPVVSPIKKDGLNLFLLDLGVDGKRRNRPLPGIFSLFNGQLPIDRRYLTGYARDISSIPDSVYQKLVRPGYLQLPKDLNLSTLEYSGIYEDGWTSADARIVLGSTNENGSLFEIQGTLPRNAATDIGSFPLDVTIGNIHRTYQLPVGDFSEKIILPRVSGATNVLLHFEHPIVLSGEDDRRVGALLRSVGFSNFANDLLADVPDSSPNVVRLGSGWYDFESSGGESYRWSSNDAEVIVLAKRAGLHHLKLSIAGGPSVVNSDNFRVEVIDSNGKPLASHDVSQREVVDMPIMLSNVRTSIRLHVMSTGQSVGADPRVLSFRVFGISVQ